jgi:hypothetical protein
LRELSENDLALRATPLCSSKRTTNPLDARRKAPVRQKQANNSQKARKLFVIPVRLYAEMIESWSIDDANRAVTAIAVILERVGALPKVLTDAYQHEIDNCEVSVTRRFYEQLAINCPTALDYFTESEAEVRESENDRANGALRPIPID